VLKLKVHPDGTIERYKARLVALDLMQQVGRYCGETYAPVSRYSTLKFLIAHCNAIHIDITHLDVKLHSSMQILRRRCGLLTHLV
jgi:hypothetical protein